MIAAIAVALALSTDVGYDDQYHETIHQTAPLAAGGEVEIDDTYGDVRVTRGASGTVDIRAVKSASEQSDLSQIDVHVDTIEGAVKITADFPADHTWFHDHQRSVDFDVAVPAGSKVILRMQYGDGSVSGVDGAVDASSRYGNVEATGAAGAQSLTTEYGDVRLSVDAISQSQAIIMHTTYGDVDLTLPANASPNIRAETHFGSVDNDFDASAAGPPVDLKTTFGDVDV